MSELTKPILYNDFKLDAATLVKGRVERIFFTEVYRLSDSSYLYLFTNLRPEEIISHKDKVITVRVGKDSYLAIKSKTHSHEQVSQVIEELTQLNGFDAVAGMERLKKQLYDDVINPHLYPEKFKKFKVSIPHGILLYGPPGCGKTFIVRKLAEELGYNFVELSHADFGSTYIHGSVEKISRIFEMAKLKSPSVVFIDEIEGLLPKRENLETPSMQHKQEEVNQFLIELNDAEKNNILVVGATNRPHLIDPAVLRSGRIDKKIFVPPPDFEARKELFKIALTGRPHSEGIDFDKLASLTENYVSSDISELIVPEAARVAANEDRPEIDEALIVSVINRFEPSVSKEELGYFEQFKSSDKSSQVNER